MERVLVVDDELLVLGVVGSMLEYLKHRVWRASNAPTALAMLHGRQHFDLVIVDAVLKESSGLDLARQIRTEHPSLPVIIMSAYLGPQSTVAMDTLRKMGVTQVLTKPMGIGDLDAAIHAALGRKPRSFEGHSASSSS